MRAFEQAVCWDKHVFCAFMLACVWPPRESVYVCVHVCIKLSDLTCGVWETLTFSSHSPWPVFHALAAQHPACPLTFPEARHLPCPVVWHSTALHGGQKRPLNRDCGCGCTCSGISAFLWWYSSLPRTLRLSVEFLTPVSWYFLARWGLHCRIWPSVTYNMEAVGI